MSDDWKIINRRRGELIAKEVTRTITGKEQSELNGLQAFADRYLEIVSPPDYSQLEKLEEQTCNTCKRK